MFLLAENQAVELIKAKFLFEAHLMSLKLDLHLNVLLSCNPKCD